MIRTVIPIVAGALLIFALSACGGSETSDEHDEGAESSERTEQSGAGESGEHDEGSESGDGGEESGTQYALDEDYDVVRAGARLKLSFDEASNAFTGTVENTTANTLTRVRVEVHLSNGIELGPTTPLDLASGQTVPVRLPASSESFETWSAHPEVGQDSS